MDPLTEGPYVRCVLSETNIHTPVPTERQFCAGYDMIILPSNRFMWLLQSITH
jgi:hypothetical protein